MQSLSTLPLSLRHAPFRARVITFLGCCCIVFPIMIFCLFEFSDVEIITSCAIPVAVASWIFRPRIAYICAVAVLVASALLLSLYLHTFLWPFRLWEGFLFGVLVIIIELGCFALLHHFLELSAAAKQQSLQAEQQLNIAYEHQQQLEILRDQFLMSVSHELRTPLTEVKGYINLLLEYGNKIDDETRAAFMQSASYGCDELELIISNVLGSSRIGQEIKPLSMQELPLLSTITEICEHIYLEEHTLRLAIPADLIILADRQQLRQVLRNLISNACKYSPAQTLIEISALVEDDSEPMVRICLQDAGPGIAADEIPLLFHKFSRLKRDMMGSVRGTGLGLYISKQFVEGMGGRIWVESAGVAGQGSCFCFTLKRLLPVTSIKKDA
ncbi:sensor histidine kinase [Dictyobacter alpinus]|uniref:sensor histidine kinase n=1 Tax=Dictyobacter alpinus TaxID=2014873 RepID=UPI000F8339C9|nr:HAMP domain-containing sensor histidine kinase [Dictyobacter alpinus]